MSNKVENIGILGGTLDPIHIGHLIIAQAALETLNLDKVFFMPSGYPPHKDKNSITDNFHRENMVKLSVENNDKFEFSDFEMRRLGIIYTADTLHLIRERKKDINIYFIMGADSLLAIETWHKPDEIFKLCTVVVADRDYSDKKVVEKIGYLENKYKVKIEYIKAPMINVSSSDIRNFVKNNKSIRYLVDEKVERYIINNKLYI